jgi:hypothetical protein
MPMPAAVPMQIVMPMPAPVPSAMPRPTLLSRITADPTVGLRAITDVALLLCAVLSDLLDARIATACMVSVLVFRCLMAAEKRWSSRRQDADVEEG